MRALHFALVVTVLCLSPVASNGQRRPSRPEPERAPAAVHLQALDEYEGRAWLTLDCTETESGLRRLHCRLDRVGIEVPDPVRVASAVADARALALSQTRTPAALANWRRNCTTDLATQEADLRSAAPAKRAALTRDLAHMRTMCAAVTREQFADAFAQAMTVGDQSCSITRFAYEVDFVRIRQDMWVNADLPPNPCGIVTTTTLMRGPRDGQWRYTQSHSTGGSTEGICGGFEQGDTQTYSTEVRAPVTLPCPYIRG